MTDRKAVIKNADMSEDMQQDAVDCATQAIEKYNIEKVCTIKTRVVQHQCREDYKGVGFGNSFFVLLHNVCITSW